MNAENEGLDPSSRASENRTALLWTAAVTVAAFGTWVMFDALPGLNWVLWTASAAAGLAALARHQGVEARSVVLSGAAATLIAGAATFTASPPLHALICVSVVVFLAMQMLLSVNPSLLRITVRFAITAPLVAFARAVTHGIRRASDATELIQSSRARASVRGLAITVPILIVFALLLAEADPTFATWRDTVFTLLNWDVVPRVVFFTALFGLVLGAYGYASSEAHYDTVQAPAATSHRWLGSTERLMLLAATTALLWLFLALQLGYFFGTVPNAPGMTFAEYARRGFGELTLVASASAVLIIVAERYGQRGTHRRVLRVLTCALIAAVLLLLASAFRRVLLYEAAYGYTTARLYAQAYMIAVAAGLLILSLEVVGDFDADRLFRRSSAVATTLFVALVYWNHEAWIARRNIDRFQTTGKLDIAYLANELSPNAIPAIADRLASLPEPTRSELRTAVHTRYAKRIDLAEGRWFEWNQARARARATFATHFAIEAGNVPPVNGPP